MGNLCSESRNSSQIEYQKPSVQFESTLKQTSFTIMQGNYLFLSANVLVNAHQSPYALSPIIKQAKISSDITSRQAPQIGQIVSTENNSSLKYQYILHTALPFWQSSEDVTEIQAKLYDTYKKVLEKADELKQSSIVFTDLTLPPMQIPIGLHAECLIGAVILYIEENSDKTNIKNITFVNSEKHKIQRYTYQLQSKLVGMNETTVKEKIRKSVSDICGYNSFQQKALLVDDNNRSLQESMDTKHQCETEGGNTANQSRQQLGKITEQEIERDELDAEINRLRKSQSAYVDNNDNKNKNSFCYDDLIDSRHYKQ